MKLIFFLLLLTFSIESYSQNLTISSNGETGTSGTNWLVSGSNPVKISSNNTSNINISVIQGYINSGVDVIISSTANVVINSDISKISSGRLIIKSGSNSISGTGKIVLGNNAQLLISQGATISNNIELNTGSATIGFAPIEIEYLIVAGGGSGGVGRGGGGGAGGVLTGSTEVSSGTYSIVVGAGGGAVTNDNRGVNGSSSLAFNLTAIGGGAGGGWVSGYESGLNGGSGGGASASPYSAGLGTSGQGNNGFWLNYYREPGGGGGGAGSAASSQDGGLGIFSNITGTSIWVGGGGGAASLSTGASLAGIGGIGGGGNGTKIGNGVASSGIANTGGGGGGSEGFYGFSGAGGSGIVILRYLGSDIASGGIEYSGSNYALGYQVYEFKQIGTNNFSINAGLFQGVFSGQISGSGNLILNPSSGIITLLGSNIYSGTTTIQSGKVQIGNNGTQGSLGSGDIINNGILSFYKTNTISISSIISGSGSIIQQGSGVLILTQNNTYSGTTTISSGSIQLGNNSSTGSVGTGSIINNGILIFNRSDISFFNNSVSGTGAVNKDGLGRINILSSNTYTGGTTVSNGILAIYNGSAIGTGDIVLSSNSSLLTGRAVTTLSNNVILNGSATIGLDNDVEFLLVGGGGGGSSGGGGGGGVLYQTASLASGISHTITIGAGGTGGLPINTGTNGANGGSTTFNGYTAYGGGGGGRANGGGISGASGGGAGADCILAGGSATQGYPGGNGPSTAGGTGASGGGGAGSAGVSGYTKAAYNALYGLTSTAQNTMGGNGGSGTVNTITGSSIYYAGGGGGGCNNNNGTQPIERAGQGGVGGGGTGGNGDRISGFDGTANTGGGGGGGDWEATKGGNGGSGIAIIRYIGSSSSTGGTVTSGTGTATGYTIHTFTTIGNNTFTVSSVSLNLTGVISGTGNITFKSTDGTITLSGNNTYNGNTNIAGGTLILNTTASLASGNYSGAVSNSGILRYRSSSNHIFSGIISGSGQIIKETSTSILKLTGNNTYSGTTTISSGVLYIGDSTFTGSFGTGDIINNSSIIIKRTNDLNISNLISGTGSLTKELSNTLTLSQNNTYSGSTTINGGTLVLQNDAPNPTSKTYLGTGQLRIEPSSASFTSVFSNTGWTFSNSLTGLTIGKSSNTSNISFSSSITINGPLSSYGTQVSLGVGVELITTNAIGHITLYAKNGFTTSANTGTTRGKIMTSGGANITINADADDNNVGDLDLDWLTIDGNTGNILIEAATYNWSTFSGVTYPEFYGTGSLTFRGTSSSAYSFNLGWLALFNTKSSITIGSASNTNTAAVDITPCASCNNTADNYTGKTLQINGPLTIYGTTIGINQNINVNNSGAISLFGNALNVNSSNVISSTGNLVISPKSNVTTIGIAGAAGTLQLPASYFSTSFGDGFSNIQIGSNTQLGNISTNSFTLRDHMTFLTSGSLTLGGKIVLGSNNLTLGTNISAVNVSTQNNYFQTNGVGVVKYTIGVNNSNLFPVGNSYYNPVSITNKNAFSDDFGVRVLDSVSGNGGTGNSITTPHVKATWNISKSNANSGSGVDFQFSWQAAQEIGGISSFVLNHHNGTVWEKASGTPSSVSGTTTKTLSQSGYTGSFSPFAFGSTMYALPVELKSFNSECNSDFAKIAWTTASEKNNDRFELFKSSDAQIWSKIYTAKGQGIKATETKYLFNDFHREKAYYRLKDIDYNGKETWSDIISSKCEEENTNTFIYPNPASDFVTISTPNPLKENTWIKIIGINGIVLKEQKLELYKTVISINDIPSGVYIVEISNNEGTVKRKLVKK